MGRVRRNLEGGVVKKSESPDFRSQEVGISALGKAGMGQRDIKNKGKVKNNVISFPNSLPFRKPFISLVTTFNYPMA